MNRFRILFALKFDTIRTKSDSRIKKSRISSDSELPDGQSLSLGHPNCDSTDTPGSLISRVVQCFFIWATNDFNSVAHVTAAALLPWTTTSFLLADGCGTSIATIPIFFFNASTLLT